MTVVLFILIVVLDIPPSLRLLIALPVGLAATGFLQAKLHFCVRFGMAGLFNMSETALKHETIDQSKYRKKDQRKALIIISSATIITLVITIITYILPISTH